MKNIVMLAHDPGGYDVIMPLYRMIQNSPEWNIRLLLVGPAGERDPAFKRRAEEVIPFLHNFRECFGQFILVTGTSWGDDTELNAIRYCKNNSNFAHRFCLCTLKIQYLAVIQLSKVCCYAA